MRQQRRFVEGGVFEVKGSETAKTAEETNISTKTPDFEYHSEPLRQHRRFLESGDFEEKVSKRTENLIKLLKNIWIQYFTFRTVFFKLPLVWVFPFSFN